MTTHALHFGTGILHYSTVDAVFRTLDGRPVAMEFHRYLGPFFSLEDGDGGWLPDVGTPEWDHLWDQFNGWWRAKGRHR